MTTVDGVDLELHEGEGLVLLGPPGAGKSALLSAVAGIDPPDSGRIRLAGEELPRDGQPIGHVPTDPGFAPRQSVRDVIAARLRDRGVPRRELDGQVADLLERMRLPIEPDLRAHEMPGHFRLLVAIAAQLAAGARVLLLDDPFRSVEPSLHARVQDGIDYLRREFGLSLVMATTEAGQALGLGDRIVLLRSGRVVQVGSPAEVYERPADSRVAAMLGDVNLLVPEVSVKLMNQAAMFSIRPEKIQIVADGYPAAADEVVTTGVVARVVYLGATSRITVRLDTGDTDLLVLRLNNPALHSMTTLLDQPVTVAWARRHAVRLD